MPPARAARPGDAVEIHYLRPPTRRSVFRQLLVHQEADCVITLMERTPLVRPVRAAGAVVLEPDAPAVWFTFADAWHDIGRFHTADGGFTGYYANLITPVQFRSPLVWQTTDLFLDVWLGADGSLVLLDEAELDAAVAGGWVDTATAAAARAEADRLMAAASAGTWPTVDVREWTLERARDRLDRSRGTRDRGPV